MQQKLASGDTTRTLGLGKGLTPRPHTSTNNLGMEESDEERENRDPGDDLEMTCMDRRSTYVEVSGMVCHILISWYLG